MSGLSIGRKDVAAQPPATHEIRAESPTGRRVLAFVGFLGYLIPGALAMFAVGSIVDAAGVETSVAIRLAVFLAIPLLAAWRGATVSASVRPTDVVVRNRWRRVDVPLGEIEAVEVGTSAPYFLLALVLSVRDTFTSSDVELVDDDDLDLPDMLKMRRRGRRRRLPMYATFGMAADSDAMRPFLDALAATGHGVDLAPSPEEPGETT